MDSVGFRSALTELIDHASKHRTAIMCAEVLPHRCHRRLIADALVARGPRSFTSSVLGGRRCTC
jgi:uncharacterized protein (DUF488 family)